MLRATAAGVYALKRKRHRKARGDKYQTASWRRHRARARRRGSFSRITRRAHLSGFRASRVSLSRVATSTRCISRINIISYRIVYACARAVNHSAENKRRGGARWRARRHIFGALLPGARRHRRGFFATSRRLRSRERHHQKSSAGGVSAIMRSLRRRGSSCGGGIGIFSRWRDVRLHTSYMRIIGGKNIKHIYAHSITTPGVRTGGEKSNSCAHAARWVYLAAGVNRVVASSNARAIVSVRGPRSAPAQIMKASRENNIATALYFALHTCRGMRSA